MARARLYGWNGERPAKPVSGQKQIVLFGLSQFPGEVKTGHEWAEVIGKDLATRQDPYRVVLYYILGLKKEGCIRTVEREIEATTVNADVKHAVVVKTDSAVEERHVLAPDITDDGDEIEEDDLNDEDEQDEEDGDDQDVDADGNYVE